MLPLTIKGINLKIYMTGRAYALNTTVPPQPLIVNTTENKQERAIHKYSW